MAKISVFTNAPRKGDILFAPSVRIWLSDVGRDDENRILLSRILLNDMEIDKSVDSLITQLEQARKNAKIFLKKKNSQIFAKATQTNDKTGKINEQQGIIGGSP